jgi:nucleoside-diphosphate-sugar epimerase
MNNKILVTGASGFIGSHLVDLLLEVKTPLSKLRLFVETGQTLENLPKKKFDIIYGDIRNKLDVKKAMKDVTTVYHLAAKIDFDGTWEEYDSINVRGTKNLVDEAIKIKGFKKFVNYSSIGVHGLPAGIGDITNWDETHAASYTNLYGKSKWEAEEVVREAHKKHKLPYIIIRPASVYGPRENGPTLALYKAIKSGQFLMIGDGSNKMHYVYVQDLVNATYLAGNSKLTSGEYIIAGLKPTSFSDVVRFVAQSIDKPVPKFCVSKHFAMLIAHVFAFITKVTGIKLPLFPSRVRTMTTTYYYDISKAKKELGYNPRVSFNQGSKIVGKWYQENGYI